MYSFEDIEGLDSAAGIKYCGSQEGWERILLSVSDSLPLVLSEIRQDLADGNIEEYRRNVHGVKSSLRSIGTPGLSDMAAALEEAAANGDIGTIERDTEDFLYRAQRLCNQIKEAAPTDEENGELPTATEELMQDAYNALREFYDFYDYGSMEVVIDSIKGYAPPSWAKPAVEAFIRAYKKLDRKGMGEALDEFMAGVSK